MSASAVVEQEDRQTSETGLALLHAQAGGTLVLCANAIGCRALKDSETIAAFALSHGSGM